MHDNDKICFEAKQKIFVMRTRLKLRDTFSEAMASHKKKFVTVTSNQINLNDYTGHCQLVF